jgi:hypothetical protein
MAYTKNPNRSDPERHAWQCAASARARHRATQQMKADYPDLWLRYFNAARAVEGLPPKPGRGSRP